MDEWDHSIFEIDALYNEERKFDETDEVSNSLYMKKKPPKRKVRCPVVIPSTPVYKENIPMIRGRRMYPIVTIPPIPMFSKERVSKKPNCCLTNEEFFTTILKPERKKREALCLSKVEAVENVLTKDEFLQRSLQTPLKMSTYFIKYSLPVKNNNRLFANTLICECKAQFPKRFKAERILITDSSLTLEVGSENLRFFHVKIFDLFKELNLLLEVIFEKTTLPTQIFRVQILPGGDIWNYIEKYKVTEFEFNQGTGSAGNLIREKIKQDIEWEFGIKKIAKILYFEEKIKWVELYFELPIYAMQAQAMFEKALRKEKSEKYCRFC